MGRPSLQFAGIDLGGGLRAKTSVCRGCQRPILWAKTTSGGSVPLDPRAVIFRVVSAEAKDDGEVLSLTAEVDKPELLERRFVSHFCTCPQAAAFSRSRKPDSPLPATAPDEAANGADGENAA
jgi:hypothetical protein